MLPASGCEANRAMTISAVEERDAVITYTGSDPNGQSRRLEEIELDHFLQFNKPQDRLFAGQIDSSGSFRLRIATLRKINELEQSPIRGLLGPRTNLIPHQLYIAHEVATRHAPRVLLADEVPGDHEEEHEKPPQEGDHDPGKLDSVDRFLPPEAI